MGGVQGHYSNGSWHWETYGIFAIPGMISDAVKESKRKSQYIEEQRRENDRRRQREREEKERQERKSNEANKKINDKIEEMENQFKQTFTIKEVRIPLCIKKNILNICKLYYNTQKIKEAIKEKYKSLNSGKRTKSKFTVFILGNTGNGKSTLLNACFNQYLSEESPNTPCHDFKVPQAFSHENLPDFIIYDTNGIEIKGENDIDNRLKEISDFIKEKSSDSEKMIDCLWYCITGSKFQDAEKSFIKKLNEIYFEKFPIILVYTQTKSLDMAKGMKNYALEYFPENFFIPVLAKETTLIGNLKLDKFGVDDLINKTRELVIKKETELKKINAIKQTEKFIKKKYLFFNYNNFGFNKLVENYFNITNEQDKESCLNEIRNYVNEIKTKIKRDNIEELFKNIEKEVLKIVSEYQIAYKKDLSIIKERFIKSMELKTDDSFKVYNEVKSLIINGIKEIILETLNQEIKLLN